MLAFRDSDEDAQLLKGHAVFNSVPIPLMQREPKAANPA
jgi:hypothetical protein